MSQPQRKLQYALPALLALQIAIAVLAGGRAWASRTEDPKLPVTKPDPSTVARPITIESGLELGSQHAGEWLPDAQLLNVNMQLDWPSIGPPETVTSLPPGGWVTMTFGAPWDGDEAEAATLSLFFDRASGQLFGQSETEWEEAPARFLSPEEARIDSTTAVLAAELAGGTDYRRECPDVRNRTRVSLTTDIQLQAGENNGLIWLINYFDSRSRTIGFRVLVDAITGDIVSTEDFELSCDGEE